MLEASLLMGGSHPRLLVLDAPRQHELDAKDLGSYLGRFYEMSAKQPRPVQLVFSASDLAIVSSAYVDAIWEPQFEFDDRWRFLGSTRRQDEPNDKTWPRRMKVHALRTRQSIWDAETRVTVRLPAALPKLQQHSRYELASDFVSRCSKSATRDRVACFNKYRIIGHQSCHRDRRAPSQVCDATLVRHRNPSQPDGKGYLLRIRTIEVGRQPKKLERTASHIFRIQDCPKHVRGKRQPQRHRSVTVHAES